ncbi:PLP-dependent aminotransferase family protein [Micromonospora sp. WMMD1219]|uniref:MocR-like pyridoxine biosynthesis transcription factor PdxR n=1 Tax=Micromonospora sp. WMMD1219 TaxID=3404115 RepID=UPI003BF48D69
MADFLLPVNPQSTVPLYEQIITGLEDAILAGQYDDGPLPSTRRLAEALGVSRNTVLTAYDRLMEQGLIVTVPRRGLYVSSDAVVRMRAARRTARSPMQPIDWAARLPEPPPTPVHRDPAWARAPFPFVVGQPDPSMFPIGAWERAQREALRQDGLSRVIGDAGQADDPELVRQLCEHVLPARGISAHPDQVMITLGSTHALHLLASVLVRPGSVVLVEDPGYPDARTIMQMAGADVVPGRVDEDGLVVADLPADLHGAQLVYVTPSHQYPTGATMSASRREELLRRAGAADAVVIEDDYDPEMTFRGMPAVAVRALDDEDRVVYLGSFSKLLAPGLRLGYVVASPALVDAMRARSRYVLRHPPGPMQRALAQMIASRDLARHVRRVRAHYQGLYEEMVRAVERHVRWGPQPVPRGGLARWITGPSGLDAGELARELRRQGVLLDPGAPYWAARPAPRHHLRLGYQVMPLDRIDEGVRRVAAAVEDQVRPRLVPPPTRKLDVPLRGRSS